MFNISKETEIKGLEKTGYTKGYIQRCLHERKRHDEPKYSYIGKHVLKGTVLLHTCKGDYTLKFNVKNGWARSVEIL